MDRHWLKEKQVFFIALCKIIRRAELQPDTGPVWRSTKYTTGQPVGEGFILGIGPNPQGQTMALMMDISLWEDCYFAKEIPLAVEGTCATSETTVEFLNSLFE
jgi:hypothetical protein